MTAATLDVSSVKVHRARSAPLLSVVIPVRNEAANIRKTLDQLVNQEFDKRRFEIIVADGESTDETAAIVQAEMRKHGNLIKLVHNPRRWSSAGRNAGFRAARGELILVIDGHCEVATTHYLSEVWDCFQRSAADSLGRPQPLEIPQPNRIQRAIAVARSSLLGHHPQSFIYSQKEQFVPARSVAAAYRRHVFERIGLFDETFDACEDVEFNQRLEQAGFSCYFSPRLAVAYQPRASLVGLFKQMMRYGRGRVRLARKHPHLNSWLSFGFLPMYFILWLVFGALAATFSTPSAQLLALSVSSYLLLVSAFTGYHLVKRRDLALAVFMPLVYFTIHFGAGTGLLLECVTGMCTPPRPGASL